mmetsp:Transcript_46396/g.84933  ORF Transcript_46396/g.84933 Transcript_46396/m.84933 type:complete len:265 (+) Transcript_46396:388-1182(+)
MQPRSLHRFGRRCQRHLWCKATWALLEMLGALHWMRIVRMPLGQFSSWDDRRQPLKNAGSGSLHSEAPCLSSCAGLGHASLQVYEAHVLNEVCPRAAALPLVTQCVSEKHELHSKPVLAIANMIVGPDEVSTRCTVVLYKVSVSGGEQCISQSASNSKLRSQDPLHCPPIASQTMVASIDMLGSFQLLLEAEDFSSIKVAELMPILPELQGLKGTLRNSIRPALHGQQLSVIPEVPQEVSLAKVITRSILVRVVEGNYADTAVV